MKQFKNRHRHINVSQWAKKWTSGCNEYIPQKLKSTLLEIIFLAIMFEKNSVSAASLKLHIFLDFSPHCTMIKIRSTACVIWTMGRRHAHIDTAMAISIWFFYTFPSFLQTSHHKNTFTFPMLCCQKDADCSLDPKPQNLGNGQMIPSSLITWIIKLEEVCP